MAETGITHEPGSALPPPGAAPPGEHHDGPSNPDVRYEPSDVQPRGVVVFAAVLAVLLVVLGAILVGLYFLLERREVVRKSDDLPLAAPERDRVPDGPQIEGLFPTQDVGRSFANNMEVDGPVRWQGYNVRLVPPPEASSEQTPNPVERNVRGREEMEKELDRVDATIPKVMQDEKLRKELLPVRKDARALPVDTFRRSLGEASSGRKAAEGAP